MRKEIVLNIKPYSVNSMYYGDARTQRSEFKDWTYQVFHELSNAKNLAAMKAIREAFNSDKNSFKIRIVAYYPESVFRTKDGRISARTVDLTNFEKPLIDLIFDKKFFDRPHPYGVQNINTNDAYITEVHSYKKAGPSHKIVVTIILV